MIRLLEQAGFAVVSTRGSHCKLRNSAGIAVIVPLGRDPLRPGTQAHSRPGGDLATGLRLGYRAI
jgi:predicted RNA binding protein YcfA (HicA-like mRNA interferase family)